MYEGRGDPFPIDRALGLITRRPLDCVIPARARDRKNPSPCRLGTHRPGHRRRLETSVPRSPTGWPARREGRGARRQRRQRQAVAARSAAWRCCDITDSASVSAAARCRQAALGQARILMNIAGIGTAKRVIQPRRLARAAGGLRAGGARQPAGHLQHGRLAAARIASSEAAGGHRKRGAASSSTPPRSPPSTARSARRPMRPARGRRGRHDAAAGARPRAVGHPGLHDRAGPVRHAADERAAGRCSSRWPQRFPSRSGWATRPSSRSSPPHRRQQPSQRQVCPASTALRLAPR